MNGTFSFFLLYELTIKPKWCRPTRPRLLIWRESANRKIPDGNERHYILGESEIDEADSRNELKSQQDCQRRKEETLLFLEKRENNIRITTTTRLVPYSRCYCRSSSSSRGRSSANLSFHFLLIYSSAWAWTLLTSFYIENFCTVASSWSSKSRIVLGVDAGQ